MSSAKRNSIMLAIIMSIILASKIPSMDIKFGFSNPTITSINSSSSTFTNLTWTNATGTNTTGTNMSMVNVSTTNLFFGSAVGNGTLTVPSSTITNLTWTNATGTNTTGTNLSITNASTTNFIFSTAAGGNTLTVPSSTITNLAWTNATGTNTTSTFLAAPDASTTRLFFGNATGTNATSTNFSAVSSNLINVTTTGLATFTGTASGTAGWTFNKHGTIMDFYDGPNVNHGQIYIDSAGFQVGTVNNANLVLYVLNTARLTISTTEWQPGIDNTIQLGDASHNLTNGFFRGTVSSTSLITSGPVTTTGAIWYAPNLSALGATGDIVCQNNTTNNIEVQAVNCTVSSLRFKEHIKSLNSRDLMDRVRKLRAVSFDFKEGFGNGPLGDRSEEGFIAEEVALIDPYLVAYEPADENEATKVDKSVWLIRYGQVYIPKTVDYAKVSVLLTGAVQNMDDRLTKLEKMYIKKHR